MWRFDYDNMRGYPGFEGVYQRVTGRPSWVSRWAFIAAAIIVIVPLCVLALAGIIVGTVVFVTLGLVAQVMTLVRTGLGSLRKSDRQNVRIRHRE